MPRHAAVPAWAVLAVSLAASPSLAQQPQPTGGATRSAWYMVFGEHPVTNTWTLHLEGQFRREDLGQRWEQLLLRPGIRYTVGHGVSAMVAYTYLRDYPFETASLGDPSTTGPQPEHRVLEELQIKHRLGPSLGSKSIRLAHRLRAEQRFVGTSTLGLGTTSWQYQERARYRLTADIPFRWSTAGARPDYASVYNEVFVRFGSNGGDHALDQNRTYGALGWDLGSFVQLEAGYLFQYMPTPNGIVGEQNHAFQLTLNTTAPFRHGLHPRK